MTAVAACAGGGFVLGGSSGASGAAPTTPVVLDHYLCAGHLGSGDCDPAKVELPDSTTFAVNDPLGHLVCRTSRHHHRHHGDPTAVELTNEFTSAPVTLDVGHKRAECTIVDPPAANPMHNHAHRSHDNAAVASFTCFSVGYSSDGTHFTPPDPVTLDDSVTVHVGDPRRLCTPNDPDATNPAGTDLLCFDVQVDEAHHHRQHHDHAVLCVPSTDPNGSIPPSVTTTSSAPTSTSTTTTTTTTTAPTTTTHPTTTTAATTTTTTSTTTTTASTTTTTTGTTTPTTQPCVGRIIDGQCVIDG